MYTNVHYTVGIACQLYLASVYRDAKTSNRKKKKKAILIDKQKINCNADRQ